MDIDFHHSTVYVLSRMAGFTPDDAYIIAYSSQYVDDAGSAFLSGVWRPMGWHAIYFSNYGVFEYIDSCHWITKLGFLPNIDNLQALEICRVWVPFHFLPNGKDDEAHRGLIGQVLCKKASDIPGINPDKQWQNLLAKDMVDEACKEEIGNSVWGLYRLGITMHVLADTWAHQNFAGIWCNEDNAVKAIAIKSPQNVSTPGLGVWALPSVGHANAGHLPDLPFLNWSYVDATGKRWERDNRVEFAEAVDRIFSVLQDYRLRYRKKQQSPPVSSVEHDLYLVKELIGSLVSTDCDVREKEWLDKIKAGDFMCCKGDEKLDYYPEAHPRSWWSRVTELCPVVNPIMHHAWAAQGYRVFNEAFLDCHYKLFQDSLISHLYYVTKVLYPRYRICAL